MNVQLIYVQKNEANSSALSETCLATKVQKSFTKPITLHTGIAPCKVIRNPGNFGLWNPGGIRSPRL